MRIFDNYGGYTVFRTKEQNNDQPYRTTDSKRNACHWPQTECHRFQCKGLVHAACGTISKEIQASGYDYIIERTERVGGDTITKATLKRWIEGQTYTPHLSKLNAVLNAWGYQLSLVKK